MTQAPKAHLEFSAVPTGLDFERRVVANREKRDSSRSIEFVKPDHVQSSDGVFHALLLGIACKGQLAQCMPSLAKGILRSVESICDFCGIGFQHCRHVQLFPRLNFIYLHKDTPAFRNCMHEIIDLVLCSSS